MPNISKGNLELVILYVYRKNACILGKEEDCKDFNDETEGFEYPERN